MSDIVNRIEKTLAEAKPAVGTIAQRNGKWYRVGLKGDWRGPYDSQADAKAAMDKARGKQATVSAPRIVNGVVPVPPAKVPPARSSVSNRETSTAISNEINHHRENPLLAGVDNATLKKAVHYDRNIRNQRDAMTSNLFHSIDHHYLHQNKLRYGFTDAGETDMAQASDRDFLALMKRAKADNAIMPHMVPHLDARVAAFKDLISQPDYASGKASMAAVTTTARAAAKSKWDAMRSSLTSAKIDGFTVSPVSDVDGKWLSVHNDDGSINVRVQDMTDGDYGISSRYMPSASAAFARVSTQFRGQGGHSFSFDRAGVSDSNDIDLNSGDPVAVVRSEIDRAKTAIVRHASSARVPDIGHVISLARKTEIISQLSAGRSVQMVPSGMGTGYTLSTRQDRHSRPASSALRDFFGMQRLFVSTFDHD